MNVDCYVWSWIGDIVEFIISSPRLPRHNLRQASHELINLCIKHNFEYKRYSFIK